MKWGSAARSHARKPSATSGPPRPARPTLRGRQDQRRKPGKDRAGWAKGEALRYRGCFGVKDWPSLANILEIDPDFWQRGVHRLSLLDGSGSHRAVSSRRNQGVECLARPQTSPDLSIDQVLPSRKSRTWSSHGQVGSQVSGLDFPQRRRTTPCRAYRCDARSADRSSAYVAVGGTRLSFHDFVGSKFAAPNIVRWATLLERAFESASRPYRPAIGRQVHPKAESPLGLPGDAILGSL